MAERERFDQTILEKIKTHAATLVGIRHCKQFAVCIPLLETNEGYGLLFEVRSAKIDRQPGDICFPGGMLEPGETAAKAAVRETCEELLVEESSLELLGKMADALAQKIEGRDCIKLSAEDVFIMLEQIVAPVDEIVLERLYLNKENYLAELRTFLVQ